MPPRPQIAGPLIHPAGEERARPLRLVALPPWGEAGDGWHACYPRAELEPELARMAAAGVDAVRLYEAPDAALLDCFEAAGLGVLAGLPWGWHEETFNASAAWKRAAGELLGAAVASVCGHPALWGWIVGNEIPAATVRRLGWERVQELLDELVERVHREDDGAWAAYAGYPPTLPLAPGRADLVLTNLYLESVPKLDAYLPVLQTWAGGRPLILGEFGLDALRHGEEIQARLLGDGWAAARVHGLAGLCVFAWSDRWWASGGEVDDWAFGLVARDGTPRPALAGLASGWREPVALPSLQSPVSAIICTHQGAARIRSTLECLRCQSLPAFELLVIDDGREPALRELLNDCCALDADGCGELRPGVPVRLLAQDHAGLGAARNFGAREAIGEVLAYLDDDSEPHPEWLERLLVGLETHGWDAAGGPVAAPSADASGRRGVKRQRLARAPGQAQPVLLGDGRAEHLPGCSLMVRASAWHWVGGWDERFWSAGDDVDFCWRLENAGLRVGFVADAFMEHRPRGSWRAYLRQQVGYGRAERLLGGAWPERVDEGGRLRWRGAVYLPEGRGERFRVEEADFPVVYADRQGFGPGRGGLLRRLQELARRWGYWTGR